MGRSGATARFGSDACLAQGCAHVKPREMQHLEEQIAHLTRTLDDLSDVVARQENEIAALTRRIAMLMQREGEREASETGGVALADEKPPHY